jgi:hypothetical protein
MSDEVTLTGWQLDIDADMILRGQGADPAVVRQRKPKLVETAEQALADGMRWIQPAVVYRVLDVESLRHETMTLYGGGKLKSGLIAEHLAQAGQVALIVCTLGDGLEKRTSMLMQSDPLLGFALDGFGTVAMEVLGAAICSKLEVEARDSGEYTSIPLSPGAIEWPVDAGQRQIFSILDTSSIGVVLNQSFQMIPRKSTSMILGIGSVPFSAGRPCDFCGLRETCHYQNRDMIFGHTP